MYSFDYFYALRINFEHFNYFLCTAETKFSCLVLIF